MKTIEEVLENEFGVQLNRANPVTILWAAEYLACHVDYQTGKSELARVNDMRAKMGLPLAYAPYGSPVF